MSDPVAATRSGYDLVARSYADAIADELAGKPLDRALLQVVVELAASSGWVADLGCGPGHVTSFLAERAARVVGVDLSPVMCAIGRTTTSLPFAAGDLTALPLRSGGLGAIVCLYAVIHLDTDARAAAYREFARCLRPGGHALIAFHVSDADVPAGGQTTLTRWWDHQVELTFRFLDPEPEIISLAAAGLEMVARLDREPLPDVEHPSKRCYLLVRRVTSLEVHHDNVDSRGD